MHPRAHLREANWIWRRSRLKCSALNIYQGRVGNYFNSPCAPRCQLKGKNLSSPRRENNWNNLREKERRTRAFCRQCRPPELTHPSLSYIYKSGVYCYNLVLSRALRESESVCLRWARGANKSRLNFIKSLFEAQCADWAFVNNYAWPRGLTHSHTHSLSAPRRGFCSPGISPPEQTNNALQVEAWFFAPLDLISQCTQLANYTLESNFHFFSRAYFIACKHSNYLDAMKRARGFSIWLLSSVKCASLLLFSSFKF